LMLSKQRVAQVGEAHNILALRLAKVGEVTLHPWVPGH
jgi:hypothetical protein